MTEKTEEELLQASKAILASLESNPEDETLSRLAEARKNALEAIPDMREETKDSGLFSYSARLFSQGIVATASACMLALILMFFYPARDAVEQVEISDLEILLETEDMALFEYDMGFYVWMEEQEGGSS